MIETKDAVNNLHAELPGLPGTLPSKAEKTTDEKSGPTTANTAGSSDEHFVVHPCNDFIARGDIRFVLLKHGWTSLGVQPDGNEY